MLNAIQRLPALLAHLDVSKSTIYDQIDQGLWTPQVPIVGKRGVGWPVREIEVLSGARIAGRSDEEIRELVIRLVADRENADK